MIPNTLALSIRPIFPPTRVFHVATLRPNSEMILRSLKTVESATAFCRRHRIRRLALFGSILRDDFGPQSDMDVLVEFEPGARTGFAF